MLGELSQRSVWRQFVLFSLIGVVGFAVDTLVLYFGLYVLHLGFYAGRGVSYICAASSTWFLNHTYTFEKTEAVEKHKQWLQFLAVNTVGGMVNYGVYAGLISGYVLFQQYPVLGVAIGSVCGLSVNFTLSRSVVFGLSRA